MKALLITVLLLISSNLIASDLFDELVVCKNSCNTSCVETVEYTKTIIEEYNRVCLEGGEPNFSFSHYCGYQCTRVCRIQVRSIMTNAVEAHEETCLN